MDGVTIEEFEKDLKNNLYKIWNRMSSGSYFPAPVRAVEIPKKRGTRILGVPNDLERVAQTVVAQAGGGSGDDLSPDSYGYRPDRSALDAVAACRQRCWKKRLGDRFGYPEVLGCVVTLLLSLIVMVKTVLPGWLGAGYAGLFGVRYGGGRLAVRRA